MKYAQQVSVIDFELVAKKPDVNWKPVPVVFKTKAILNQYAPGLFFRPHGWKCSGCVGHNVVLGHLSHFAETKGECLFREGTTGKAKMRSEPQTLEADFGSGSWQKSSFASPMCHKHRFSSFGASYTQLKPRKPFGCSPVSRPCWPRPLWL